MRIARYGMALAMLLGSTMLSAQSLTEVSGFGSNPGNLRMFKWVPNGLPANAPLVVALHGCTQSAASYDVESGWAQLAQRWQFALLLPQQQSSNNSSTCFNWFESGDISRGSGEALSIRQMVQRMLTDHAGDPSRVYVTGLSAGGAMTAVMLATYPELFAGGAIIAGIPYRCGTGTTAAFSCMNPGSDLSPQQWGSRVRAASSHDGPWPVVSIWHGASDTTVRPANLTEAMEQWTDVHGIDQIAEVEDTLGGNPRRQYKAADGSLRVETVLVSGMGHGTPVDPGSGEQQCGTAGAYLLDVNLCSSYWIGRFWGLDNLDGEPPQVALTAPADGSSVSGVVTVSASASDNVGVQRVEFLLDGALLGSDSSAPYSLNWNSAAAVNGAHVLQARAFDLAGNSATSDSIAVTVSGGLSDTTPPSVALVFPADGATLGGSVTLSAEADDDFGVVAVRFLLDGSPLGNGSVGSAGGPWTLAWNTTAQPEGNYLLRAEAIDAAGNSALSAARSITLAQNLPALDETLSDRDGNGDGYDEPGWSGGFALSAENATVGVGGSQSLYGEARSGGGCQVGTRSTLLQRNVLLGAAPVLAYARRLDLKANTNTAYSAAFRLRVAGTVVDQQVVSYASYSDASWQRREGIDLSAWAGQAVSLEAELSASANVCIEAHARAWLDDLRIVDAEQSADRTPPTVQLSAPVDGSTVAGVLLLAAQASDDIGVAKVEFHANGSLLGQVTAPPYELAWDTTQVADGSYALMARAYDAAGNVASDDDTTVTVDNATSSGGTQSAEFASLDAEDGYTKANASGGSAALGTLEASYGLAIGRGSDGKFNRALLSFDTASLPDDAEILAATLVLTHRGSFGDPWSSPAGNRLVVDLRTGCFGAGCTLVASDHSASATVEATAEVQAFSGGTQESTGFNAAGLAALAVDGRTQLRLRFADNPTSTRYMWIGSGAQAVLRVSYRLP